VAFAFALVKDNKG